MKKIKLSEVISKLEEKGLHKTAENVKKIVSKMRQVKDIKNISTQKEAEKLLKQKNLKWDKTEVTDMGGVYYTLKGKEIAMWFKKDRILTLY